MMAGFFVINPLDFWVQFLMSEMIGHPINGVRVDCSSWSIKFKPFLAL